jgi:hypothetical protein
MPSFTVQATAGLVILLLFLPLLGLLDGDSVAPDSRLAAAGAPAGPAGCPVVLPPRGELCRADCWFVADRPPLLLLSDRCRADRPKATPLGELFFPAASQPVGPVGPAACTTVRGSSCHGHKRTTNCQSLISSCTDASQRQLNVHRRHAKQYMPHPSCRCGEQQM